MEVIYRNGERIQSFSKWEAMSVCEHYDNDPQCDQIYDEEQYLLDEQYYNGEKDIIDYLSKCNISTFYTVHYYRFLEFGENTYESGETFTNTYYVDCEGSVIPV